MNKMNHMNEANAWKSFKNDIILNIETWSGRGWLGTIMYYFLEIINHMSNPPVFIFYNILTKSWQNYECQNIGCNPYTIFVTVSYNSNSNKSN